MPRGVYLRTPEIVASLQASAKARRRDTGWCQVAGCDNPSSGKRANIFEVHYGRVQYERGKAATYECIDCEAWRRTGQYTLASPPLVFRLASR
jgi:hypothetical protein